MISSEQNLEKPATESIIQSDVKSEEILEPKLILSDKEIGCNLESKLKEIPIDYSSLSVRDFKFEDGEIISVEDCLDDEEDELVTKNADATDLFANVLKERISRPENSTRTGLSQSKSSSRIDRPRLDSNSNSNNEDDPFVKAALERFDAFCKSKSTHNLDQAGVSAPPTPSTPILQRQKSPFLPRKMTTGTDEQSNSKPDINSFIKRRQARIDPNSKGKTEDKNETSNEKPILHRSMSETRTLPENKKLVGSSNNGPRAPAPSSGSANTPLASSSLAKKFLGSLTPQLEPIDAKTLDSDLMNYNNNEPDVFTFREEEPYTQETESPLTTPNIKVILLFCFL